jgi:hypothetical protein
MEPLPNFEVQLEPWSVCLKKRTITLDQIFHPIGRVCIRNLHKTNSKSVYEKASYFNKILSTQNVHAEKINNIENIKLSNLKGFLPN